MEVCVIMWLRMIEYCFVASRVIELNECPISQIGILNLILYGYKGFKYSPKKKTKYTDPCVLK